MCFKGVFDRTLMCSDAFFLLKTNILWLLNEIIDILASEGAVK
jgi:hypothetical protein